MCKDIRWSIYKRKDTSQHVILHNLTLQSIALHREMITYTFIRPCNYRYGNVQSSFVWICVTIENTWRIHSDARGRYGPSASAFSSEAAPFTANLSMMAWRRLANSPHQNPEVETQSPSSRWYSSSPNPLWRTWLASQDGKTLVLRLRWGWDEVEVPLSYTNPIHVRWLFLPGWLFFKTRLHHLIRQSLTRSSRSTNLVDWHKSLVPLSSIK